MNNQKGQAMTEYLVISLIVFVALIIGGYILIKEPEWSKKSAVIVLFGALVATLGWSTKRAIETLNTRTRLLILELLSNRESGLLRNEIELQVKKEYLSIRLVPGLIIDALSHLLSEQVIIIENSRYFLIANKSIQPNADTSAD